MAIAKNSIGSQRQRQFAGAIDPDMVFETKQEMNSYLSRAIRYAGMIVTCLEEEGKIFVLNNDTDSWIEVGASDEDEGAGEPIVEQTIIIQSDDYSVTKVDVTAPVAVGNIKKGQVIPKGTTLEKFLTNFLFKAPLLESRVTSPSFSVSLTSDTTTFYVGETATYTITFSNVTKGSVIGDYVEGVWQNSVSRGDWAGNILSYKIDDEVITPDVGVYKKTFTDVPITSDRISHVCEISFDDGSVARLNSVGETLDTFEAETIKRTRYINGRVKPTPEPEEVEEEVEEVPVAYPTFVTPTISATHSKSYQTDGTIDVTLKVTTTESALRGSIKGDIVDGSWDSTEVQDYRLGAISGFSHSSTSAEEAGTATLWGDSSVKEYTVNIPNETTTFYVAMQHAVGAQPVDSEGENYGSPSSAGYIHTTVRVTAVTPPVKYYTGIINSIDLVNASNVLALGSKVLSSTGRFTFTVPSGTQAGRVPVIAYPATRASTPEIVDDQNMPVSFDLHATTSIDGVSCYIFTWDYLAIDLPVNYVLNVKI